MQYKLLHTTTDFEIVILNLLRVASACEHTEYSQPDLASTLPHLYRSTVAVQRTLRGFIL